MRNADDRRSEPSSARAPTTALPVRLAVAAVGGIVVASVALRLRAVGGDLWLDEIWSLENLAIARAAADVDIWLALFFFGNTHPLNTLYLAAVGPDASALAYRALSLVSGVAAVAVAAAIGWRHSRSEAVLVATLVGISYAMVNYASEARGYTPMMLAALASFHLFDGWLRLGGRGRAGAFVVVSLLGFASHATFAVVLAGLAAWAALVFHRRLGSAVSAAARLVAPFGIQAVVVTAYFAVIATNTQSTSGPFGPIVESVRGMLSATFGIDPAWSGGGAIALALGLALAAVVGWLYRRGDASWIFFAIVVIGLPLAVAAANPLISTVPRYFFVDAVFALIVAARGLDLMLERGRRWRLATIALVALFVVGNGIQLDRFFDGGRGRYTEAVRLIAADGDGPARVAGYHPLRVGAVLTYHARRAGLADAVRFTTAGEEEVPASWYITDGFQGQAPTATLFRSVGGGQATYRLAAVFPHWGLSGDTWAVYRRRD